MQERTGSTPCSFLRPFLLSRLPWCPLGVKRGRGLQPTTSTSHFLTAAIKFSFLALALSLFSTLMSALLSLFFFSLKGRVEMQFTAETSRVLEMQNFIPAYMKGWTYVRTDGRLCFFTSVIYFSCSKNMLFLH